jgi:hypothetical protein
VLSIYGIFLARDTIPKQHEEMKYLDQPQHRQKKVDLAASVKLASRIRWIQTRRQSSTVAALGAKGLEMGADSSPGSLSLVTARVYTLYAQVASDLIALRENGSCNCL